MSIWPNLQNQPKKWPRLQRKWPKLNKRHVPKPDQSVLKELELAAKIATNVRERLREQFLTDHPKAKACVACSGSGKSSSGNTCYPCDGMGYKTPK